MTMPNRPMLAAKHPVRLALRGAARQGFNPYDNHTAVSVRFAKVMRDRVRRVSEAEANRLLAAGVGIFLPE